MGKSITVRFSEEEERILQEKITMSGMTQSEFIRSACLNCNITILDPDHQLFYEVTQLISGINEMNKSGIKKKGLKKEAENICKLLQNLLTVNSPI